jgi:hypothetical protein
MSQDSRSPIENWTQNLPYKKEKKNHPPKSGARCASEWYSVLNETLVQISRFWQRTEFVRWPTLKKATTGFRQTFLFPFTSWQENAGQNHNIKIGKRSFEKVTNFKHTEQSLTQIARREIKSRISTNACYRSFQKLSSSLSITINVKTELKRSIILPVLYVYETWSPSIRQEHMLRISENRLLKETLGSKTEKVQVDRKKLRKEELHSFP